jgi:hypothetical protein
MARAALVRGGKKRTKQEDAAKIPLLIQDPLLL